jgi:hypothetical protein
LDMSDKGDYVAVASGMDIPLILRRTETDNRTPMGYAYIDGLVKGDGPPENADDLCDD